MKRNALLISALIILILLISLFILQRKADNSIQDIRTDVSTLPINWKTVETREFSVSLPEEWQFKELQGIDSYIGEFSGKNMTLSFDFGFYSNSLPESESPDYETSYEMIDGHKAKIVFPKNSENGIVGIYFEGLGNNKLTVYGENITREQRDIAFLVFRGIRFDTEK